jgi:putative restriction endonuclease
MGGSAERQLLEAIQAIKTWKADGQRAPHKPLLLLLGLARIQRGDERLASFRDVEEKLRGLLRAFGPARKSYHPEYPFWRLQADGLWDVPDGKSLRTRMSNTDPPLTELRKVAGGFPAELDHLLRDRPDLVQQVVRAVLAEHFEPSLHEDILAEVGLSLDPAPTGRCVRRGPEFRALVLRAYAYRCAVCGLDLQLDGVSAGLEGAHVWWHTHGGPSTVDNGLSLCPLHHKAFDLGAIGVAPDHRVLVSQRVHGGEAVDRLLLRHHGAQIVGPQPGQPAILGRHQDWHYRNVFRQPARPAP